MRLCVCGDPGDCCFVNSIKNHQYTRTKLLHFQQIHLARRRTRARSVIMVISYPGPASFSFLLSSCLCSIAPHISWLKHSFFPQVMRILNSSWKLTLAFPSSAVWTFHATAVTHLTHSILICFTSLRMYLIRIFFCTATLK